MLDSKPCFKCGETKSLSDFYKHNRMSDGHHSFYDTNSPLDVVWLCPKHHKECYHKYDKQEDMLTIDDFHKEI